MVHDAIYLNRTQFVQELFDLLSLIAVEPENRKAREKVEYLIRLVTNTPAPSDAGSLPRMRITR